MSKKNIVNQDFNLLFPFRIKDASSEGQGEVVVIEGFANYAGSSDDDSACYIDRSQEVVVPSGVSLTNYKKNPVILMNHDRSRVIGKAISVTKKPEGIFVTAEVHAGAAEAEDYYAIKNGLVTSFSIGFKTLEGSFKEINGKNIYFITKSELYETSCVSIPCNAASGFSVVKSMADGNIYAEEMNLSPESSSAEVVVNKNASEDHVKLKLRDMLPEDKVKEIEDLGMGASLDELQEVDTKSFIQALVSKEVQAEIAKALEAFKAEQTKSAEAPAEEAPAEEVPASEEVPAVEEEAIVEETEEEKAAHVEFVKTLSDFQASLKALVEEK